MPTETSKTAKQRERRLKNWNRISNRGRTTTKDKHIYIMATSEQRREK
jgi:hypothetical protein